MTLLFAALVPGVLVGWAVGGRLGRLAALDLRAPAAILAAVALQFGLGLVPRDARLGVLTVSSLLVGVWLLANARNRPPVLRLAIGLLALGWLLNVAVMVPNRGMPVSSAGLARIGAHPALDVRDGNLYKHVPADRTTTLRWLGDVLPVPPLGLVASAGDLVMAVGLAVVVTAGMAGAGAERRVATA